MPIRDHWLPENPAVRDGKLPMPAGMQGSKPAGRQPRPSAAKRLYGRRWRAAARAYLREYPTCSHCGEPAACVDHVIPHRGDLELFWDRRNWQALCWSCHSSKTRRE